MAQSRDVCIETLCPEFEPQELNSRRKEPPAAGYPVSPTKAPRAQVYTHTHTRNISVISV